MELKDDKLPIGEELSFFAKEAYNVVRTNLNLTVFNKKEGKIIGIISADPQEGKSTTSINLAYALAKNGSKTLLIEGDLRKPTIRRKFKLSDKLTGLSEVLCNDESVEDAIIPNLLEDNLSFLPSGAIPPNPSELLGSSDTDKLLKKLAKTYDYIIIDLPPVNSVIDAIAISPFLDGFIFICRLGWSQKKKIIKGVEMLKNANARILGFVTTGFKGNRNKYYKKYNYYNGKYGSYYSYGYGYENDKKSDDKNKD